MLSARHAAALGRGTGLNHDQAKPGGRWAAFLGRVARDELQRMALDIQQEPGEAQRAALTNVLPIAVADADIKSDETGRAALSTIIEAKYVRQSR